jgi:hypothetical protein
MRFALLSLVIALFATFAMAVAPQRAVIISWPNETPDHIVEDAKEAIRKAKGVSMYIPDLGSVAQGMADANVDCSHP